MALGTKRGLMRHWWVLISFLLTSPPVFLVSETRVIADRRCYGGRLRYVVGAATLPATSATGSCYITGW